LSINWPLNHPIVDRQVLRTLFDLSPREAAIAATLAAGADLRQLAMMHEISLQTVRSHLKSIFLKTDTHRQSELVALLLNVSGE
jgi:DNA-binding CsgD family transcriptional regulator